MNVEGLRTEQENLQVVKQEISLMEGIYVSFCALMSVKLVRKKETQSKTGGRIQPGTNEGKINPFTLGMGLLLVFHKRKINF